MNSKIAFEILKLNENSSLTEITHNATILNKIDRENKLSKSLFQLETPLAMTNELIKFDQNNKIPLFTQTSNSTSASLLDTAKTGFCLGLFSVFVKCIDENSEAFHHLVKVRKSAEMVRAGHFYGGQIDTILNDSSFVQLLDDKQLRAIIAFNEVSTCIITSREHDFLSREEIRDELVIAFDELGAKQAHLNINLLNFHLNLIPPNATDFSEEMG